LALRKLIANRHASHGERQDVQSTAEIAIGDPLRLAVVEPVVRFDERLLEPQLRRQRQRHAVLGDVRLVLGRIETIIYVVTKTTVVKTTRLSPG
jgi:hypothetical protein